MAHLSTLAIQPTDTDLTQFVAAQESNPTLEGYRNMALNKPGMSFCITNHLLYRKPSDGFPQRLVVPTVLREALMSEFHNQGHFSANKIYNTMS